VKFEAESATSERHKWSLARNAGVQRQHLWRGKGSKLP
jgi:hypothetical protein